MNNLNNINIIFTDHSLLRINERNISKLTISKLINNIEIEHLRIYEEKKYSCNHLNLIKFCWNNDLSWFEIDSIKKLKVVGVFDENNTFIVITAYYDENNHNLDNLKRAVSSNYINKLNNPLNFQVLSKGKSCI